MARARVLYISYDGMLEPLGQSQVIAYLEHLASDCTIHLVSFEKPDDRADKGRFAALAERLAAAGIVWHPLTYHKQPTVPATLFDVAQGAALGWWLVLRHRLNIIHARSYLPALMGRIITGLTGARLLFDMRGLWADERIDGGLWPAHGRLYRMAKRLEQMLLRAADQIVTLTHASVPVLASFPCFAGRHELPVTVIPTCADLDRFSPGPARPAVFTLGYVGSIGTWYLFDEVLACFRLIRERRPDARLLVVNRNQHDQIRAMIAAAGIDPAAVELVAADHAQVPVQVRRMSAGAALTRPAFSKIASAPTKLAEYLGCGVPCLGNGGVGDVEQMLAGEGGGIVLTLLPDEDRAAAIDRLLALCDQAETPAQCRAVALRHFSLDAGVAAYRGVYRKLLA